MAGFAGQDPLITSGGFVEKVTKKFIAISKTKSDRMASWIQSNSKSDGLTPAQQQQAVDQGMQDAADDIALAIYESLKEMNGSIVSNSDNDPDFWNYMSDIPKQFNPFLGASKSFTDALKVDMTAQVGEVTALKTALSTFATAMSANLIDPALATACVALAATISAIPPPVLTSSDSYKSALGSVNNLSAVAKLLAHMEK